MPKVFFAGKRKATIYGGEKISERLLPSGGTAMRVAIDDDQAAGGYAGKEGPFPLVMFTTLEQDM